MCFKKNNIKKHYGAGKSEGFQRSAEQWKKTVAQSLETEMNKTFKHNKEKF